MPPLLRVFLIQTPDKHGLSCHCGGNIPNKVSELCARTGWIQSMKRLNELKIIQINRRKYKSLWIHKIEGIHKIITFNNFKTQHTMHFYYVPDYFFYI